MVLKRKLLHITLLCFLAIARILPASAQFSGIGYPQKIGGFSPDVSQPTAISAKKTPARALNIVPLKAKAASIATTADTQVSDMLETALPAVVTLAVVKFRSNKGSFAGIKSPSPSDDAYNKVRGLNGKVNSGSGFTICSVRENGEADTLIVTNLHVVDLAADSAGSIFVQSINGSSYRARILNGDALYDLAILEFIDQPGKEIRPVQFRDTRANPLRIGEGVFAIGNPIGMYPYSISTGIISGLNRIFGGVTGKFGYLQTDATVIDGSSGSPLLDRRGQVVGMMTKVARTRDINWASHLNFALEAAICQRLTSQIAATGNVERAWFGIQLQAPPVGKKAGDPFAPENSFPTLVNVLPNASNGNLLEDHIGKQLINVDGNQLRNIEEALGVFERVRPGEETMMVFSKGGKADTVFLHPGTLNKSHLVSLANRLTVIDPAISGTLHRSQPVTLAIESARLNLTRKGKRQHFVLAGGRYTSAALRPFMHEILYPEDLGTAIRQYALTGTIDLVIIPEGQHATEDNIDILSVNFDGTPATQPGSPTLFY